MAGELSQEALLDFLCQAGGRVRNAELLSHFKGFLRDPHVPPGQQQQRRELFKGFVNSVAAVRQDPDGTKYVVLKRRYRDLLGEEGLQRPTTAEGPQRGRRRPRDPEAQKPPAGAATRVDSGGDELAGSSAREATRAHHSPRDSPRDSPSRRTPEPAAAQTRGRCAAVETRGRCCWECQQNGWGDPAGQPLAGDLEDPAASCEEPEFTAPARDDLGPPGWLREGASADRAPVSATPVWPPAAVQAAGSPTSPPALPPLPAPSSEPLELFTAGFPNHSTQQLQQQQRTREWVARYPQVPEAGNQGPTRAWSVLPDNFLQLSSKTAFGVSETQLALPKPELSFHSLLPVVPDESSESWPGNPPPTVFRSIRCQLSLQDLNDFVDQESHGSEESSSGPKESPGTPEEWLQPVLSVSSWGDLRDPIERLSVSSNEGSPSRIRRSLRNRGNAPGSQTVPTVAKNLGDNPQEASPWPAPKFRRSFRRSTRSGRTKSSSSSDEEHLDEDLLKRSRRPPRSRKTSRAGALPSPRVDIVLVQKLPDANAVAGQPHTSWVPGRDGSAAMIPHRSPEHRSPLVPLDAREHEWIVKLASGSWPRVEALFWEDPQLALHRDFLTGYTALHWIAKHGDLSVLQRLISGAQKAGVALDVNVRSSCGYTPLHLAAIHGHQGVIKLLVQRLASRVNIRDFSGKKPWQYLTGNVTGETWQLLGAPRGKPIFPVYPLVQSSSPARKVKSREVSRNVTRKSSLAARLKSQHNKWKLANQYEKFHTLKEREEYSD